MNEAHDPNRTVYVPTTPSDCLDAGLAAGFGAPRSSLEASQRPLRLREAEGDSAHVVKPHSDAMPPPEQTGNRYQIQGEIARGGMGAVLRGRDVDLGRDLAVKVLLEKHADRPEVVRRFIEEAQIGGQLQHPGVVPVYDIGRFGGRPFFTMKLVKGLTLAALLAERADASADRPRFLGIALQVAQTLAYAHAKGVIHRDLKPANIMVGAFGEVQVMDWGLAKVLAEGGLADEESSSREREGPEDVTTIRTARSSGSAGSAGTQTEAGSLLGTPAYMPPEQANGDIANLDRRADVFGLGAILCEILTGKPPYVGRSSEEVRRKAANGDLADSTARLDACGADQELIALPKACLSPEAIDRPKDAQEVADRLSAYLNGVQERLQTAERERAVAVAREAEQRKRRRVQLALAAALVLLLVGGGAFAFWRNEQAQAGREREARNAEAVAALLGQAEEALKADDAARAAVVLEAVKKRAAEGGAEKEADRLGRLDADLALLRDLDVVDQFRATWSRNGFPDPAVVATWTREALKRFGADPDAMPVDEAAARVSASVVRERIVSVLDRLLRHPKPAEVRALLRRVDADPYRDAVRDAVLANDPAKMVELARQDDALEQPPGFVTFLGESPVIPIERKRQLLQAAVTRRPGNLHLLMTLGTSYMGNEKEWVDEQVRWHQAAIAAAPANYAAHNNLGVALDEKGQLDDAIACYNKAIALNPKNGLAYLNLGTALRGKGQVDEAIACYNKAIELDAKDAKAHGALGNALKDKGQVEEAIACFRQAIALDPKLAVPHYDLGNALRGKGQVDEAIACYRKAIALDPKYAEAHNNLGAALFNKGQVDEAIARIKKAIALDPKKALAHSNLGHALKAKGQLDDAIACFRKATLLDPKVAKTHYDLGEALKDRGQLDEAIACIKKAIELDPKNIVAHRNLGILLKARGQWDGTIACWRKVIELDPKDVAVHCNLGAILCDVKRDYDGAIACFRKAIELDPKLALAHNNLGTALDGKGQVDEAIAYWRKAIALDPKLPQPHDNLAYALANKGQLDEAIASWRKVIALDPKNAVAHRNLGVVLNDRGQFDEAIACYRKAIALDPKDINAHNGLGAILCDVKRDYDGAIACFRKVIALNPKLAMAHSNLGRALAINGKGDEAIACIRKAIALDPKNANAHNNLGSALKDKGKVDEAIACFRKVIELDPKDANAHCNLGLALADQGRFAESLAALKRGHELGTRQPGWCYPSAEWVRQAELKAAMEPKLPAFLKGEFQPTDTRERLGLAGVCKGKKLHQKAIDLYSAAFTADPKLADDLKAEYRYNAARCAALAAAGQGEDAARLDNKERTRLRKQALDWLRAELTLRTKQLESGKPADRAAVQEALSDWQKDVNLASLRDKAALAKLPADEQKTFTGLWTDVATLLKKAESKTK
jgi:tetratricopeptide (TPR) repeat protein